MLVLKEISFHIEKGEIVSIVGHDFATYLHTDSDDEDIYEEAGEDQTKTIPLKIVGITENPTKEWMEDCMVYISPEVLGEVESFTGTAKGMIPDYEEGEGDSDSFDDVKVYANNLQGLEAISDELEDADYATYSVVSEMKQISTLFTIAKAGLILLVTILSGVRPAKRATKIDVLKAMRREV